MMAAMNQELNERTSLARRIGREAGAILMTYYGQLSSYERKGTVDFVTAADKASEEFLVTAIREMYPDDEILAEEGGTSSGTTGWQWILDPLDGTTNFVHSFPLFMVSIGILHKGIRVAGVCYGPVFDEEYWAIRHQGAYLNDQRIHVSDTAELGESLVATGFPYNRRTIVDSLLKVVKKVMCNAHGIRRCGAAAYDQCFLAAGRVDGFYELGLSAWDVAAGTLIIEEAGGCVGAMDGGPLDLHAGNVIASNGQIHEALRRCITE